MMNPSLVGPVHVRPLHGQRHRLHHAVGGQDVPLGAVQRGALDPLEVGVDPEDGVALLVHGDVHRARDRRRHDGAPLGAVEVAPLDPGLLFSDVERLLGSNFNYETYFKYLTFQQNVHSIIGALLYDTRKDG